MVIGEGDGDVCVSVLVMFVSVVMFVSEYCGISVSGVVLLVNVVVMSAN